MPKHGISRPSGSPILSARALGHQLTTLPNSIVGERGMHDLLVLGGCTTAQHRVPDPAFKSQSCVPLPVPDLPAVTSGQMQTSLPSHQNTNPHPSVRPLEMRPKPSRPPDTDTASATTPRRHHLFLQSPAHTGLLARQYRQ